MKKLGFPLNAHVVSWPTSIKNLVITLERTFLSLSSSFCHFIVPHPSVIFQAHVGKAFPFPSSEDATEATATEARGCKVESSSSSLQAAAASPRGHSINTWTKRGFGGSLESPWRSRVKG